MNPTNKLPVPVNTVNPNFAGVTQNGEYAGTPTPISVGSQTNTPIFQPPPPTINPNYQGITAGAVAGATTPQGTYTTPNGTVLNPDGSIKTPSPTASTETATPAFKDTYSKALASLGLTSLTPLQQKSTVDIYKEMTGLTDEQIKNLGIGNIENQNQVNSLTAELNAITAESTAAKLGLERQDVRRTTGVLDRMQGQIDRETAIRALPVSAKLLAAQGRLDSATKTLDKLMGYIETDQKNESDRVNNLYSLALTVADKEQTAKLNELKIEQDTKDKANADFQTLKKTAYSEAIQNGDIKGASEIAKTTNQDELAKATAGMTAKTSYDTFTQDGNVYQVQKDANGKIIGTPQLVQGNVTPSTITYKFTPIQLNTGAATAALGLDTFKALDGEVQNFYINSKPVVTQFNEALAGIKDGSATPEQVKINIQSMNIPNVVKQYLSQQVDSLPKKEGFAGFGNPFAGSSNPISNYLTNAWSGIKSSLGF